MTPDEVRSGIAANPQTTTERARLINAAIENNMADEIPDDWGIGVGQSPDEPAEQVVRYYGEIITANGVLYIMVYQDGTLVMENEGGNVVHEFSNEQSWALNELRSLEDDLKWAREVALDSSDFRYMLGERPIDPVMLLHSWRVGITGPGGSPALIVGIGDSSPAAGVATSPDSYSQNFFNPGVGSGNSSPDVVVIRIQDQNYFIADLDELDDAVKDVEKIIQLLRRDFE